MKDKRICLKILAVLTLLLLLLPVLAFANPEIKKTTTLGLSSLEKMRPNGEYVIDVFKDNKWHEAGSLSFDKNLSEREIDLNKFIATNEPLKIRLTEKGGGAAHIDSIFLGGMPPQDVKGSEDILALKKLSKKDFDVTDSYKKTIELVFPSTEDMRLALTARIEAEVISKTAFQFPSENLRKDIKANSKFYAYKLSSGQSYKAPELIFKEFSSTGSGHPSGYTYSWAQNDDENLYVKLDFTPDNTMDGDKDYSKLYVKTDSNVKEFKVSANETKWGTPDFTYTDKVPYQHKVYEFKIPFQELGINRSDKKNELLLAFSAYGTAASSCGNGIVEFGEQCDDDNLIDNDFCRNNCTLNTCVTPPTGMVSWWTGDNSAIDIIGGHNGTLQGGMGFNSGLVGQAFSLDGVDDYVMNPNLAGYFSDETVTIELWFNATGPGVIIDELGQNSINTAWHDSQIEILNTGEVKVRVWNLGSVSLGTVTFGTWHHAVLRYNKATTTLDGFLDGVEAAGNIIGDREAPWEYGYALHYALGAVDSTNIGSGQYFQGFIDEVSIFNRALSAEEVASIYNAGNLGKCRSCVEPPSGMVSWWKGEDNADDLAGSNNGTFAANTYADSKVGKAFSFNGTDTYVQVGALSNLVMTNAMTIDAWIFPTGPGSPVNGGIIVNKEGEYEVARYPNGTIQWAFASAVPGWAWIDTGYVALQNQWTHIAIVYAAGVVRTYANGNLVHTYNGTGSIGDAEPSHHDFRIGGRQLGVQYFQGLIDEVEIFNRTLSADEIASIYNAGSAGKCQAPAEPLPDLTGNWEKPLTVKCKVKKEGLVCKVKGKLIIRNIGDVDAEYVVFRFYLSDDDSYGVGDILLKADFLYNVNVGKDYKKSFNLTLPVGMSLEGRYIIVYIDAEKAVTESDEDNNFVVYGEDE